MSLNENIKNDIIKKLKTNSKISNAILFGSYAYGNATEDSDIDLLVILNEKGFINNYSERIQKRVMISQILIDIIKKTPIDILVYTTDEWKKLLESGVSFYQEIKQKGINLI